MRELRHVSAEIPPLTRAALSVAEVGREDDPELVGFLDALGRRSSSVLAYHYPFYRDMLATIGVGEPSSLAARAAGVLVGYLPVFVRRSAAGVVLGSLPFFGPNGGVLCGPERQDEIERALLGELVRRARALDALGCSIYTPFGHQDLDTYDDVLAGWTVVPRFTQWQTLAGDRDRRITGHLRRAARHGVEVSRTVTPARLDALVDIYGQSCRDHDIPPKPRACVELLTRPEIQGRHARVYFALQRERVIGGLLVLWSPRVASFYLPCTLDDARALQPGTMLLDAAMREAQDRGMSLWNWEGSPGRDSGAYRFKRRWGATEGASRIYVQSFAGLDRLRALGRAGIAREFPHFFVWPFDQL